MLVERYVARKCYDESSMVEARRANKAGMDRRLYLASYLSSAAIQLTVGGPQETPRRMSLGIFSTDLSSQMGFSEDSMVYVKGFVRRAGSNSVL